MPLAGDKGPRLCEWAYDKRFLQCACAWLRIRVPGRCVFRVKHGGACRVGFMSLLNGFFESRRCFVLEAEPRGAFFRGPATNGLFCTVGGVTHITYRARRGAPDPQNIDILKN